MIRQAHVLIQYVDKSSDIDKLTYKVQADESTIIKLKSQINTMEGTICHLRQTIEKSGMQNTSVRKKLAVQD